MTKRTALITGGNRGLGRETTRQLGRMGWAVFLTARDRIHGREVVAALAAEGLDVRFEVLDVAREDSVRACAQRLHDKSVQIDVLVNNAGVYPEGGVLGASEDGWHSAIATNFAGALWMCRAFVPSMLERGWGRVVNVSSGCGSFGEGLEGSAPYSITKAAMNGLTVKLAEEIPTDVDVKVNAVCPGWVKTRMGGESAPRSVEEGAETIVWLATLESDGPTGGYFRDRQPIPW